MIEKRIPRSETESAKAWFAPILGSSGTVVPTREKQIKEGSSERIEHLEAYIQDGYIRAEVLEKLHQQIYDDAKTKAEADGYKAGYEKGFTTGQRVGETSGYQSGELKISEEISILQSVLDNALSPLNEYDKKLEKWIYDIAKQLSLAILRKEFSINTDLILPVVQELVSAIPFGNKTMEVFVCPEDAVLLNQYLQGKQLPWNIHSDNSLDRGDCLIKSVESQVDYTLAKRVEDLLDVLTDVEVPADIMQSESKEQHVNLSH